MPETKLNASAKAKKGSPFYWIFAAALLVILVWVFWESAKNPQLQQNANAAEPNSAQKTPAHRVARLDPSDLISTTVQQTNATAPLVTPAAPAAVIPVTNAIDKPVAVQASPVAVTNAPTFPDGQFPRPVKSLLEAQIALVEQGISPGSLDGAIGSQTRAALCAYQRAQNLPITGELDAATKQSLQIQDEPYTTYIVTPQDLARLQPLAATWVGKSEQSALDYETILELVSEKSFSNPDLIQQLNPRVDWKNVTAGTILQVPNAAYPDDSAKAASIVIHLAERTLEAFDAQTNLLVHFPCSIAKHVEKRPVGELHVAVVAPDPNYTFDPDVFPESAEAKTIKRKLILPPGPNNPVGVAWIGLDKPGYGIHGTPAPEQVGRTESHGCFRLANWNAEYLLKLITVGTPVYVVE